jgi:putative flippase GtrA
VKAEEYYPTEAARLSGRLRSPSRRSSENSEMIRGNEQLALPGSHASLYCCLPRCAGPLVSFGIVGFLGFAVDAIFLFVAIKGFGFSSVEGRIASISAAMLTTWVLNRIFTFKVASKAKSSEFAWYAASKSVGLAVNMLIYAAILQTLPTEGYPLFALVIASFASLTINFILVKRFVFSMP